MSCTSSHQYFPVYRNSKVWHFQWAKTYRYHTLSFNRFQSPFSCHSKSVFKIQVFSVWRTNPTYFTQLLVSSLVVVILRVFSKSIYFSVWRTKLTYPQKPRLLVSTLTRRTSVDKEVVSHTNSLSLPYHTSYCQSKNEHLHCHKGTTKEQQKKWLNSYSLVTSVKANNLKWLSRVHETFIGLSNWGCWIMSDGGHCRNSFNAT